MQLKNIFFQIIALAILSLIGYNTKAQANSNATKYGIKKFEVTIVNSNYSMAYSVLIILTNKQVKIIYRGGLEAEKDTLLFSKPISLSDTLKQVSEIDLRNLKA